MLATYHSGSFFLTVYHFEVHQLCTHPFTVDFLIIFYAPYTTHMLVQISLSETFSKVKNRVTLPRSSLGTAVGVAAVIIFLVNM